MTITVNGKPDEITGRTTLKEYLAAKEYPIKRIVVSVNDQVVGKSNFETTPIKDGDVLDIMTFVGGG